MGQPQFMPSNFYVYAVDFSGDGKRDIWNNVPDVLGSIGNYLKKGGWTPGLPWGFEVIVPDGFDTMRSRGTFAEWKALGFRPRRWRHVARYRRRHSVLSKRRGADRRSS